MKSSRIQSNLLQQNCFVRDCRNKEDLKSSLVDFSYESIDESTSDSGVKVEKNVYPYPITPQYVNSFVDSSDYRKDPISAINCAPKRSNLGDISGFQSVASMDMESARVLYKQLSDKFAQVNKNSQSSKFNVFNKDNVVNKAGDNNV